MSSPRSLAAFACLALVACEAPPQQTFDATHSQVRATSSVEQGIQGGTLDTTSSNVVGILITVNTAQGQSLAICSGSLIAPNLVLTAHHCVADVISNLGSCTATAFGTTYSPASFMVTMNATAPQGVFNTGFVPNIDNQTWFGVSAVATSGNTICGGDMAVLRLSTNINSVCPLIPRVDSAVTTGEAYTAVGFGATGPTQNAPAGTRYSLANTVSV